ncbi:MAG TPA: branched-chain amino acid ABC transporter permease [Acidimicrobiales bacterium]|jgi:branched-chain amino acid transport system permease protein
MGSAKHLVITGVVAAIAAVGLGALSPAQAQEPTTTTTTQSDSGEPAQTGSGEVIRGRLSYREGDETIPVEGAELTVTSADATFQEQLTTDEDGEYSVDVPGPGQYAVQLDPKTLPDGVTLRGDETRRVLNISPGGEATALFRITSGDDGGGRKSKLDRAPDLAVQGIRFGLIIAMCAIGLSLIFATTGLVNFSHAEMVTFGALMAYYFNQTLGWNILVAGPLAILCGAAMGGVMNRGLWRPLRNRGTGLVAMLVVSIGLAIALRYSYLLQFGGAPRSYAQYSRQLNIIEIGPVSVVPRELWIIGLSILVLVGVALFLQRTRLGKAMRAVSDNKDLAESTGINVEGVISWVWLAGGALAATGGLFQGLSQQVRFDTGLQLLLLMFAAVILGGLGTAYGALVGGLAMGLFIQLSTLFVDTEFKTAAALLLMIIVLMIRPQGILGQAERVG